VRARNARDHTQSNSRGEHGKQSQATLSGVEERGAIERASNKVAIVVMSNRYHEAAAAATCCAIIDPIPAATLTTHTMRSRVQGVFAEQVRTACELLLACCLSAAEAAS